ncbi:hypothetical protein F9K91_24925 [Brucella tritici]|uniref:Uncharacterized protein n=1 Tax=Brucella tritici TaxID=94626 RepID=A0A7X6JBM3_9HYPH|nr:hypothetical protein [Brucella tritici]KAB2661445.1 hypothetical protein F9K91_24925 [Brucella tritici]NKW09151.1 hypothetical protein [Brucella tritici]
MAENEEFLRELHTGLALVRQQQKEINRRLGLIETALRDKEEKAEESRSDWWTWFLKIIGQAALVTALIWAGRQAGIEVAI